MGSMCEPRSGASPPLCGTSYLHRDVDFLNESDPVIPPPPIHTPISRIQMFYIQLCVTMAHHCLTSSRSPRYLTKCLSFWMQLNPSVLPYGSAVRRTGAMAASCLITALRSLSLAQTPLLSSQVGRSRRWSADLNPHVPAFSQP